MPRTATISWNLVCRFCTKTFFLDETKTTAKDNFVLCPNCEGWSGHEMKSRRYQAGPGPLSDPGQDKLILELYAWIVVDPKTNLEGICGFMADGIPRIAITDSLDEAKRWEGLIRSAERQSSKRFKLVSFIKRPTEVPNHVQGQLRR